MYFVDCIFLFFSHRYILEKDRKCKGVLVPLMVCLAVFRLVSANPYAADDIRYVGEVSILNNIVKWQEFAIG